MFLSRLIIKNYRSIANIDLSLKKGKNIIVGRNNAGKSNIVKAIDLILGENSPTYLKSENITEADFFTYKEETENGFDVMRKREIIIYCELTRDEDEELNYDEIDKCFGFYKYNKPINKVEQDGNFSNIFEVIPDDLEREEKTYVNPKLKNQQVFKDEFDNMHNFAFVFRATINELDKVHKEIRFLYRENSSNNWNMTFIAPIRNEFLQSAIINSFRDPQNQLRLTNYTWYGKLMKQLTSDNTNLQELNNAYEEIKTVANKIFNEAKNNIQNNALDIAFPNAEIFFQLNEDSKNDIYKDCKIYIDDGIKSPLSDKGSGIQSATLIGLFTLYTKEYNTKSGALLCVEEPELYLHPHARRVISDKLDDFLDNDKNQVIITTHSSEFIRTTKEDCNIILVKKEKEKTIANPISIRGNKSLLLNNNHNEIFFADKVIICEGFDDYIIRWVAEEKFPQKINSENVSIVTAGSKDNIALFAHLIIKLGIECYIFADFDFLLRDKAKNADIYKAKKHDSIVDLKQIFFKQNCIFGDDGEDKFNKLIKIRECIKKRQEKKFYTAKEVNELESQEKIKEILSKLRKNGIGILDGEIENLSLDTSLISTSNKLSLKKIFQINSKLITENKKISDLFNIHPIEEFLNKIL